MDQKNIVICNLPAAGLGNKLLVWARATAFAKINNYPLLISPWYQVSVGPLLRRERQTRFYLRQIKSQGLLDQFHRLYLLRRKHFTFIKEPPIEIINESGSNQKTIYVFQQNPHWSDFFKGIRNHRELLSDALFHLIPKPHLQKLETLETPIISLHVRRGDFRELNDDEDFARVGSVRTPLKYFTDLIYKIRTIVDFDVPITIFSDGYAKELKPLLQLPEVYFSTENEPIVDMLLMAKSKVIILSAGSTFSQWSGFLSNAAIIHHYQHFHSYIRDTSVNEHHFEGILPDRIDEYPNLIIQNLKQLLN